jgi:hypothetical protein
MLLFPYWGKIAQTAQLSPYYPKEHKLPLVDF